jgi:hypothetical protein
MSIKEILITVALVTAAVFVGSLLSAKVESPVGGGGSIANTLFDLTQTSTTTGSFCATCPVKLLDQATNREYAHITNDSDTTVFLVFTTDEWTVDGLGGTAATSTVLSAQGEPPGLPLDAGETFIIDRDNLIYDYVWATSTLVSKRINITHKP